MIVVRDIYQVKFGKIGELLDRKFDAARTSDPLRPFGSPSRSLPVGCPQIRDINSDNYLAGVIANLGEVLSGRGRLIVYRRNPVVAM